MRLTLKQMLLRALRNEFVPYDAGKLHGGKSQLEWHPVRPGTVKGFIGAVKIHDNADGHLLSESNHAIADINYLTGAIELEPSFRIFMCAGFELNYYYDTERGSEIEYETDVDLMLTRRPF